MADRSFFALVIAIAVSFAGNAIAADRHVKIINTTSTTMKMFFASNIDTKKWEEDIFGDYTFRPKIPPTSVSIMERNIASIISAPCSMTVFKLSRMA